MHSSIFYLSVVIGALDTILRYRHTVPFATVYTQRHWLGWCVRLMCPSVCVTSALLEGEKNKGKGRSLAFVVACWYTGTTEHYRYASQEGWFVKTKASVLLIHPFRLIKSDRWSQVCWPGPRTPSHHPPLGCPVSSWEGTQKGATDSLPRNKNKGRTAAHDHLRESKWINK